MLPPDFVFLNPEIQLFRPAAFTARDKSDESRHSNNWQQFGATQAGRHAGAGAKPARCDQRRQPRTLSAVARDPEERALQQRRRRLSVQPDRRAPIDADDAVGRRDLRAADRLRQRRQSRPGAIDVAHSRAGDAARDGRDLRPAGAAGAHRIDGALDRRRRGGTWARMVGAARRAVLRIRSPAVGPRSRPRCARRRFHRRC